MREPFLRLAPDDDVAVALRDVPASFACSVNGGAEIACTAGIPQGHKVALRSRAAGDVVRKYGQPIGVATRDISPGDWVHTHNLSAAEFQQAYEFAVDRRAPPVVAPRTFLGYRRHDGRAATRNYIGVISTVNCSATSSRWIAQEFAREQLRDFPNVDGVIALVHQGGCGFGEQGPGHQQLARTLAGFAQHPNIAAFLVVGLGCETAQAQDLVDRYQLVSLEGSSSSNSSARPWVLNIQDQGGVAKTVQRGVAVLREMLPDVNLRQREPIPAGELILATECGGSDGLSGVTANPALGVASELLIAQGGTSILSETPEIYGGEQLLTRRAASREIGERLLARIRWWEDHARRFDAQLDNNPSVGNKRGGLTTILEKSLGAISKGGGLPLQAVYEYAERVTAKGFVVMDTPGFDPASVTGMIAGGAHVVVFTTGRGSCFGCKPVPTIKVATNSQLFARMPEDMDINAGAIAEGEKSVEHVGEEIFESILRVASGEKTKSEAQGIGDEEFCPWVPGPVF